VSRAAPGPHGARGGGSPGALDGDRVSSLRVAVIGCGLIGTRRAAALVLAGDELVACCDIDALAARRLAERHGCHACATVTELLDRRPQAVVVVAVVHDRHQPS
jgi:predicted dehydrogenase